MAAAANEALVNAAGSVNTIMWFRKGLRLHDNPALLEACSGAEYLHPIFILDPHFRKNPAYRVGVNRYKFLLDSLSDLDTSLRARGSRLIVLRGTPREVLPRVLRDWNIKKLCFEVDTEPYAKARDTAARDAADAAGAVVHELVSHTLYDTAELVRRYGGKPPLTMGAFIKLLDKVGAPLAPVASPPVAVPPILPDASGAEEAATGVPTLAECGYTATPTAIFKGGETAALERLRHSLQDTKWVAAFEKPATDPSAFQAPATTVLSPYLKFGCLSARLFHAHLLEVYSKHPGHSKPPTSLRGQLLWREFFYTVGGHTPNFTVMAGNPLCRQIPWVDNDEYLQAWRTGRTGYPWIDALMRQLAEWGWMHHLGRHSVACFLTRGDLYVSWERGQEVFEELLIDQDTFINAGNWMWLSASAFFNQYFRVYSPITFGKKYDKNGALIRRFVPELRNYPAKYIYEPWTAPVVDQKAAGCIIGTDYPRPVVDHAVVHKECISRMTAAYRRTNTSVIAGFGHDDLQNGDVEDGGSGSSRSGAAATSAQHMAGSASNIAAAGQATAMLKAAVGHDRVQASKGDPGVAVPAAAAGGKRQRTLLQSGFTATRGKKA